MVWASFQRRLSFHHPLNESRELDKGFGRRSFFRSVAALRELTASGNDVDALALLRIAYFLALHGNAPANASEAT